MASLKTCPHPEEARLILSGTAVRRMLARREPPPTEFTRPEVARVLMETLADGVA
jgi:ATP sulfurylase